VADLKMNYSAMKDLGIAPDARFFLPPFEWYNDSIASWCNQYGLRLVNFSPGTSSNQDWTYPQLGKQYVASDTIYNRILRHELLEKDGLNGFILLTHPGTDPRRKDKFYDQLDNLITVLEQRGYRFVALVQLLN
jgi:peptidoglycan/xylan/chitin deacetylase (PgdA/CDA1 family)